MNKWLLLKEIGEPREFEITNLKGEPIEESHINYINKEGEVHKTTIPTFDFDTSGNTVQLMYVLTDVMSKSQYWTSADNIFYDRYEECLDYHLKNLESAKEKWGLCAETELNKAICHFKVFKRMQTLDDLLK